MSILLKDKKKLLVPKPAPSSVTFRVEIHVWLIYYSQITQQIKQYIQTHCIDNRKEIYKKLHFTVFFIDLFAIVRVPLSYCWLFKCSVSVIPVLGLSNVYK